MKDIEIMVNMIEHRINETIDFAAKDYKANGASIWGENQKHRIYGMIEVLKIITGKDYYFDANGLHERKA